LQRYLKDREFIVSVKRKPALIELCYYAAELGMEIDPDGLVEDRADVIRQKLCFDEKCLRYITQ